MPIRSSDDKKRVVVVKHRGLENAGPKNRIFVQQLGRAPRTVAKDRAFGTAIDQPNGDKMATRIVTDSTCSVPPALAAELDIVVVAQHVIFGTTDYRDQFDLDSDSFFDMLETSPHHPTTSQATPTEVAAAFEPIVAAGDEIIGITVASTLSGTYSSFMQASEQFPDAHIHVVDSMSASLGGGLIAIAGARLAAAGTDIHEICEHLEALRNRTKLALVVPTLEYLRKGGRVGNAQALIGSVLGFKPVLEISAGVLEPIARARGMRKALRMLADYVVENSGDGIVDIGFVGSGNRAPIEALRNSVLSQIEPGGSLIDIQDLSPALGVHAGREAIAVAFTHS